jgi:hypothetical protein
MVEGGGFKRLVSNEITLEVNQVARVDLKLQVGAVDEQVTISDVATTLQTENVTVGNVISGNTTTALPLNGRNFQQLTLLVPGTINPNPGGFNTVGQGAQGRPYVNGNREQGNAFLLDGMSVDETIDNRIGYKPNVDAIAEFRVETSNSSSEFGNVTGATVNATLKSGTNDFHGNIFEFFRNDALDAQTWANNRPCADEAETSPEHLRWHARRPDQEEQAILFCRLSGNYPADGRRGSIRVAPLSWRQGNLRRSRRSSGIPKRLVPAQLLIKRPVFRKHHSGESDSQSGRQGIVRRHQPLSASKPHRYHERHGNP